VARQIRPVGHDRVFGAAGARFIADGRPLVVELPAMEGPTLLMYAGADKGSIRAAAALSRRGTVIITAHCFEGLFPNFSGQAHSSPCSRCSGSGWTSILAAEPHQGRFPQWKPESASRNSAGPALVVTSTPDASELTAWCEHEEAGALALSLSSTIGRGDSVVLPVKRPSPRPAEQRYGN
jgi:hypothetical protein